MKKILSLICLLIFFMLPLSVSAISKNDILNYIDGQTVCDQESQNLYNSYRVVFSRMLAEKNLSDNDLENIMYNLKSAVDLLHQNNICKKQDLSNLASTTKEKIQNYLYDGAMIIYNAKPINPEIDSTGDNGIVFDSVNKTINIYQNGSLSDKVSLDTKKFNYVGNNKLVIKVLLFFTCILIIAFVLFLIIKKKHTSYKKMILDILVSLIALSSFFVINILLFNKQISFFLDVTSLLRISNNSTTKQIILNNEHEIISYLAYGDDYANLIIDNLNIKLPVAFGDNAEILTKSIGHSTTSYLPGEGGSIVYSGHNNKIFLYNLKDIKEGDLIKIETNYGKFTYQVKNIEIMAENDYGKLTIDQNQEKLILYTCYPFDNVLYNNQRFVVIADLIKSEWVN